MKEEVCIEPIVLITKRNEIDEYRAIHNPIIELPDKIKKCEPFDMTIKVGSPLHPNTLEHHISWIQVFLDDNCISWINLTPMVMEPIVHLRLRVGKKSKLRVAVRCNMHGHWRKEIEIEPE